MRWGRPGPEELLRAVEKAGVSDPRLLQAIRATPRAEFVPPEHAGHAYYDRPVPIPHHQVTTQPSLVARMVEALALTAEDRVLEIGTGYGWQTALLARLAARVWSVERWEDLAQTARRHLERQGLENVQVVLGDGSAGLPKHAPYQAILVSAAFPRVPEPLQAQLAEGGRLVQPIGQGGNERVILFRKEDGRLEAQRVLTGAYFVRLYGRHGFGEG